MKITSPVVGEMEVSADRVIDFPAGLPGFENCRQFTLVPGGDPAVRVAAAGAAAGAGAGVGAGAGPSPGEAKAGLATFLTADGGATLGVAMGTSAGSAGGPSKPRVICALACMRAL
mgnify:CR=1 FL=1